MAYRETIGGKGYLGTPQYWNFFNTDSGGVHPGTCCGQAAIFSYLRTVGDKEKTSFKSFVLKYPPNTLFGSLGSSRERIVEIIKANGYKCYEGRGGTELRKYLKMGRPAIVCQDVGAAGWGTWGLHWTTVFGYDANYYYLTNWENPRNACTPANFNKGWSTGLTNTVAWSSNLFWIPWK